MKLSDFVRHISGRGIQLGLDRMALAWEQLQSRMSRSGVRPKVVLVAGTNGKGSTAKRLESACRQSGLGTYLYTSPHLTCVEERYRFDGRMVASASLEDAHRRCLEYFPDGQTGAGALTPFEWMTLVGLELALGSDAKIWILEVGLGGRFDATNVVSPDLSIITSIGRDHMDRLGGTLEQVAFEKAGVLRPGIPAVLGATAADYIQHEPSWVMGGDAQWSIDERSFSWECSTKALQLELPGTFPAGAEESLSMAIVAADFLLQPAESGRLDLAKAAALAQWPARMQLVREDPTVLVDGAHNEPAMRWLRRAVKGRLPDEGVHIVAGFRPDKDITSMIKILAPLGSSWTFVQDQGGFLRAPADYVDSLRPYLSGPIHETNAPVWDVIQDIVDPTLVCGSLYLCGELLAQMGLNRSLETLD